LDFGSFLFGFILVWIWIMGQRPLLVMFFCRKDWEIVQCGTERSGVSSKNIFRSYSLDRLSSLRL